MKMYEVLAERNEKIDEFLGFGVLGAALWRLFIFLQLAEPVKKAYYTLQPAYQSLKNQDPDMTAEKFESIASHALAECSIELTALIIGNKLIGGVIGKLTKLPITGPVIGYFQTLLTAIGQTEFMKWINSEEVAKAVGDWLTGLIFTEKFPIIGNSGPLYEKYVGGALLKSLQELKPEVEKLKQKAFNIEPDAKKLSGPRADIDSTSTAPTTPAAQVARQTPAFDYGGLKVTPGLPGAPERFNVSLK